MASVFKGREELISRILKIYESDCKAMPMACDVGDSELRAELKRIEEKESFTKNVSCEHNLVVPQRKVTFCSAAEVASTTTTKYFFDITDDGSLVIPDGSTTSKLDMASHSKSHVKV